MEFCPTTDLRYQWPAVEEELLKTGGPIMVTKYGRTIAALLSTEKYDVLQATAKVSEEPTVPTTILSQFLYNVRTILRRQDLESFAAGVGMEPRRYQEIEGMADLPTNAEYQAIAQSLDIDANVLRYLATSDAHTREISRLVYWLVTAAHKTAE